MEHRGDEETDSSVPVQCPTRPYYQGPWKCEERHRGPPEESPQRTDRGVYCNTCQPNPPPQKKSGAEGRGQGTDLLSLDWELPDTGSVCVLDPPGLGGCLVAFVLLFLSVVPPIGRGVPEFQRLQPELLVLVPVQL